MKSGLLDSIWTLSMCSLKKLFNKSATKQKKSSPIFRTSILFLDKQIVKKTNDIIFVKVEADGFNLGAQRREIKDNDLPLALEVLNDYKKRDFVNHSGFYTWIRPLFFERWPILNWFFIRSKPFVFSIEELATVCQFYFVVGHIKVFGNFSIGWLPFKFLFEIRNSLCNLINRRKPVQGQSYNSGLI